MSSSDSERNPVEELAEEFVARYRRGERPALTEYTDRYPQWADKIRVLFPALLVMERVRPEPGDSSGPESGPRPMDVRLERVGDYRILREIGRGGMGVVYEAEQISLGRHVALKVLPASALLDPRHLQRFKREARAAARLHHTNIVPVHGVGEQDGLHYYVMQFIPGQGLDQVLTELKRLRQTRQAPVAESADEVPAAAVARSLLSGQLVANRLDSAEAGASPPAPTVVGEHGDAANGPASPGEGAEKSGSGSLTRVHLPGQSEGSSLSEVGWPYWHSVTRVGLQVADALAYASSQGILHRDIKPSNLLLDTRGTVWVADFGLAKADTDRDNVTDTGDIVGTLRYMAPERFQGHADVRSDLYALGLTLYELLTLRPAFDETDRNKLIAQVMHDQPPRPRQLSSTVPRDLETIVLKAIAHDPAQRYQTPAELAEDLQRFLDDRPIKARRQGLVQRGWRWCRRHPAPTTLLVVFVVSFVAIAWLWRQALSERSAADRQRDRAQNHYERAFAVVDRLLTRVGEKELASVPYMDETRRQLLEDALGFYRGFLRDEGDDPAVRREIGQAHGRIARVQHLLGRVEQAEESWGSAIDLQQGLVAEFPHEPSYQLDLALSRRNLAVLQHLTARTADAERTLQQLLDDQDRLSRARPDLVAVRVEQGEDHFQLGVIYHETRRYDEAEAAYRNALKVAEALARDEPVNPDYQETRARCLIKLGLVCRESRRMDDAEKHYVAARGLVERLVSGHPVNLDYQATLASVHNNLATLLTAKGRRPEAEESYRRALALYTQLAEDHPGLPGYQTSLAKTCSNFALHYSKGEDPAQAEAINKNALKLHEDLLKRYPTRLECAVNFAGTAGNQGDYLQEQGKAGEALAWYSKTIDVLTPVLAAEPRHTYARLVLHNTHHSRAGAYLKLNQPEAAAKDWRRMVELGEGERHFNYVFFRPRALAYLGEHARATSEVEALVSTGSLHNTAYKELASVYSLCSAAVRSDAAVAPADREVLAERYAVRAVALLAKAAELGFFQPAGRIALVRTEEKFRPLQARDDFRKLLTRLEETSKAAPK
jgi:serine/threonine protein kinase